MTTSDLECPNLFLVTYPSGRKTWLWRGRINGRPEKAMLGVFPACNTQTARREARYITRSRDNGDNVVAARREKALRERRSRIMTCDHAFNLYVEHHCRPRNKRWKETERIYYREVSPVVGKMPIYDVDAGHLMPILREKVVTAPIQCNRVRGLMQHWLKWCAGEGSDLVHLDESPAERLPKLGREQSRERVLDEYELSLLLKVLKESNSIYSEPIRFIIHTGCRRAEAFEMRWDELKELDASGVWTLPRERSKNGRELVLPLPPTIVDMLKHRRRVRGDNELVWQTNGRSKKGLSGFSKALRSIHSAMSALAAEETRTIEHWVIHDLRRTFVTRISGLKDRYRRRIPHDVIFSITNHKPQGIRAIYNRYDYYDEKEEALEIWAEFLETLKIREYRQLSLF